MTANCLNFASILAISSIASRNVTFSVAPRISTDSGRVRFRWILIVIKALDRKKSLFEIIIKIDKSIDYSYIIKDRCGRDEVGEVFDEIEE